MNSMSRRSFVAFAGLGALSLFGCGSPAQSNGGDKTSTPSASTPSKGMSAESLKTSSVESNGKPFQVIDYTYAFNKELGYVHISYAVRNNLTDATIAQCPVRAIALDAQGNELPLQEVTDKTGTINPGEVAYFCTGLPLADPEVDKFASVKFDAHYEDQFTEMQYLTCEPIPTDLFTVKQGGEIDSHDYFIWYPVDIAGTSALEDYQKSHKFSTIEAAAVFVDKSGKMVAVAAYSNDAYENKAHIDLPFKGSELPEYEQVFLFAAPKVYPEDAKSVTLKKQ